MTHWKSFLWSIGFLLALPVHAEILTNTVVVAKSGHRSPDDTGVLSIPQDPVVQNGGRPAFTSDIREGGFLVGHGLFRGDGSAGSLRLLVRSGDPSPDANGNFNSLSNPSLLINDSGSVAFRTLLEGTLGFPLDQEALFLAGGSPTAVKLIARGNQPAPGGSTFIGMGDPASLNNRGQVAFFSGQTNGLEGIYRGDGSAGSLISIVLEGQARPGGGQFAGPFFPIPAALNEAGQVAFVSEVLETGVPQWRGIFRGDGSNPIRQIVRVGDATPSGNGTFASLGFNLGSPSSNHPLNEEGQIAFVAGLAGTSGGTADNAGIFRGDEDGLVEVVRRGSLAPDGNGRYLDFSPRIYLNDSGQVLFLASLTAASGGAAAGLFSGSGGAVTQIARVNGPAPGGGLFNEFLAVLGFNRLGQSLFSASVNLQNGGLTNDLAGLFFYDGATVHAVAREGDTISGHGVISSLRLGDVTDGEGPESTRLNDLGQVTYNFTAGGDIGIALWTKALIFNDGFESGSLSSWSSTP